MNSRLIMGLMFILFLVVGCACCDDAFISLHLEGSLPEPIIQLERGLTASEIHVYKRTPTDDDHQHETEYWGAVAPKVDDEKFLREIRYGALPDGFRETVPVRELDEGDYYATVAAHVHVIAGGQFVVERAKSGKLIVVNYPRAQYADRDSGRIVEIFSAVKIIDGYIFSAESVFEVDGTKYSLRQKAIYGRDGEVEQFLLYKPEGTIEYSKAEILKDKKIIDYAGLPFEQKWTYESDYLVDNAGVRIRVRKVNCHLLMHEVDGDRVLFYQMAACPSR